MEEPVKEFTWFNIVSQLHLAAYISRTVLYWFVAAMGTLFLAKIALRTYSLIASLIYGINMAAMGISFMGFTAALVEVGTWVTLWLPAFGPLTNLIHGFMWTRVQASPAALTMQAAAGGVPWISQSCLAGGAAVSSISCMLKKYGR